MTISLALGNPWDPYIQVPGASRLDSSELASSTVRALLSHRAVRQVRSVVEAVDQADLKRLPLVLQSLDAETGGQLTRRIANMMAGLERFLTQSEHADVREKLAAAFRPMGAWVRGQFVVTSPVVLVVQSILYSHCEWFRPHLFEAYSAARAHEELRAGGVPEGHRRFVAALIAHQTLLRGAWSTDPDTDPKEVFAFYAVSRGVARQVAWAGGDEVDDPDRRGEGAGKAVSRAIADTLYPFIAPGPAGAEEDLPDVRPALERQLAAALILHTLCLACRNQRTERPQLAELKKQALQFLDYLLDARTPSAWRPSLAFLQYGRVVHQANRRLLEAAKEHTAGLAFASPAGGGAAASGGTPPADPEDAHRGGPPRLPNVTLCFQRVSTRRVWEGHTFDPRLAAAETCRDGARDPRFGREGPWALIAPTLGEVRLYGLGPADYIAVALGLTAPGPGRRP